jgi:hypothetical protein
VTSQPAGTTSYPDILKISFGRHRHELLKRRTTCSRGVPNEIVTIWLNDHVSLHSREVPDNIVKTYRETTSHCYIVQEFPAISSRPGKMTSCPEIVGKFLTISLACRQHHRLNISAHKRSRSSQRQRLLGGELQPVGFPSTGWWLFRIQPTWFPAALLAVAGRSRNIARHQHTS